ncbi:hypothetical protein A7985_11030 [Pseudoalteromonas luteoviolacea]|uniref:Uncharacterized protein n=1 Tax=Pseudoalteromonas luteoviolacea TaxID=43657 RepID=A0A1C0TQJ9_9GAMM|nr:hypothetical protein [Pseudoalteromonas luteoviolacea]OCQ21160.1 hypothetical protein A7985_11030 [Pseudoalteromonas luteoviolacea]
MPNAPHGQSSTTCVQNNVILNLKGGFNFEGVVNANNKLKSYVLNGLFSDWNLVITIAPETLLTPDSIDEVIDLIKWLEINQCRQVVYVTKSNMYDGLIASIFKNSNLRYKFCTTLESALEQED